jgi:hypothetical protein
VKSRFLTVVVACLGLLFGTAGGLTSPANAVINGTFDGQAHPNVGMIFGLDANGAIVYSCTGTLVAPDVVLTAAHCLPTELEFLDVVDVVISFEADVGFAQQDDGFHLTSPYIEGEPVAHPLWAELAATVYDGKYSSVEFLRQAAYDIGVLLLDQPAETLWPGIEPAEIAPEGTLDQFTTGTRNVYFTQVGYGLQQTFYNGKPGEIFIDGRRMRSTVPLARVTPTLLKTLSNYRDVRGEGAPCQGDSGSPIFYEEQIVALHTFGQGCIATGGGIRLDTTIARQFLARFIELP